MIGPVRILCQRGRRGGYAGKGKGNCGGWGRPGERFGRSCLFAHEFLAVEIGAAQVVIREIVHHAAETGLVDLFQHALKQDVGELFEVDGMFFLVGGQPGVAIAGKNGFLKGEVRTDQFCQVIEQVVKFFGFSGGTIEALDNLAAQI